MGEIGDDLAEDKKTQHRIGIDLVNEIQAAENCGNDPLVMLLLELAGFRLKSKGYELREDAYVPSMKEQLEVINGYYL